MNRVKYILDKQIGELEVTISGIEALLFINPDDPARQLELKGHKAYLEELKAERLRRDVPKIIQLAAMRTEFLPNQGASPAIGRIQIDCPYGCGSNHDAFALGGGRWEYRCPENFGRRPQIHQMDQRQVAALDKLVQVAYRMNIPLPPKEKPQ